MSNQSAQEIGTRSPIRPARASDPRTPLFITGILIFCVCLYLALLYAGVGGVFYWMTNQANVEATQAAQHAEHTATARAEWTQTNSDSFDYFNFIWYVGEHNFDNGKSSQTIANGKYVWTLDATQRMTLNQNALPDVSADFVMTIDAFETRGNPQATYGITFRKDAFDNYYFFEITNDGYFNVRLVGTPSRTLVRRTRAESFVVGKPNRISVQAEGAHFIFFINEKYVADTRDTALKDGRIGLSVTLARAGEATFEFDNFALRARTQPTPARYETRPNLEATRFIDLSTATAQAASTLAATRRARQTIITDPFDREINRWSVGQVGEPFRAGDRAISNGKYRWSLNADAPALVYALPNDVAPVNDFEATLDGQRISENKNVSYGLVFRYVDDKNFYLFRISEDGRYVFQIQSNGTLTTLGSWFKTDAIQSGKLNRLIVNAQGAHFIFLVNGRYVGEAEDKKFSRGRVGIVVGTFDSSNESIIEFENFELTAP